jgi:hypothetical protein
VEKPVAVEEKPAPKAAEKREKKSKQTVVAKEEGKSDAKTADKKTAEKSFEINKVSLIEAKNKAMIIMNMNTPGQILNIKTRQNP